MTMETTEVKNQTETATESDGEQKSHHHHHRHHKHTYRRPEISKMRLLLMACAILYTYSLHPILGDFNVILLGFAFPALYIISGYLVLRKSENIEKRILRTIKRTAICFVILFAVYFSLSLLSDREATLAAVTTKRFWFDFLVLNDCNLSVGFPIWYIQALLYAYIIIYLIYKLKLLKFDIYIAAFCLAITFICGDIASAIGFDFFGHTYISGNFLTRAIPYILIGCFIHRKKQSFSNLKTKHYGYFITCGVVLSLVEYAILIFTGSKGYVSHLLGTILIAIGISLFCFNIEGMKIRSKSLKKLSRFELMIPFFVCSPINALLRMWLMSSEDLGYALGAYLGIITAILSFLAMYVYVYFRSWFDNNDSDKSSDKYDDSKGYYGYKSEHHGEHHHHHDKAVLDIGSEEPSKTNTPE